MVIFMANVGKFFDDHPEFENQRQGALERAKGLAEEGNIISAGAIEEIFGDLAQQFRQEMTSHEHIMLALEQPKG